MIVTCANGCVASVWLLLVTVVIGYLVIQAVGLGTVVFFIIACAILGVVWYRRSATKKGR